VITCQKFLLFVIFLSENCNFLLRQLFLTHDAAALPYLLVILQHCLFMLGEN